MPATWNSGAGMDGDGDGKADINNPHDAIYSQGHYMCAKLKEVDALLTAQSVAGNRIELALAAYNAGTGAVESAGGIPINGETEKYVPKIINAIPMYQGADGSLSHTMQTHKPEWGSKYRNFKQSPVTSFSGLMTMVARITIPRSTSEMVK